MYDRLVDLCAQRGTTISALCLQVTGNKGNLATWKKGYMRSDWLAKCAEILDTSADYILTGEPSRYKLTDDERDLLEAFAHLTRKQKRHVICALEDIADKSTAVTFDFAAAEAAVDRERETVGDHN